ncbi:flippase [Salinivibrio sp. BNH]|uniref:flippase n=1 Tax=Salinivibrio sp. SS3 TaxID=1895021 RepID=UPI0009F52EEE|nr:flippase [Salinivibrio sp. BNH]
MNKKIIKKLLTHTGFVRYFKNTTWLMAEQFLRLFSGLLVGIWVARYLGPEQFGLFSYVIAFTAIFGGVAKLGLDGVVVRELINNSEKENLYLSTAFWLKMIGAVVVILLMLVIVNFSDNDAKTKAFIFIISIGLLFQSFEVVQFYFQSQVLAKLISICKIVQLSLSSIIKILLVLNHADLFWFVCVITFDAISLAVSYLIAYRLRTKKLFLERIDFRVARNLMKDSWPLMFSAIIVMIYTRIDQIMIKEMLGDHKVGLYSAAVRLSEATTFIPTLITASIFPAILNAKKISSKLYNQRIQSLYTFMVWTAISIALPITLLSDWLILFLFGEEYRAASAPLMIHIWTAVFVFLGVAFSKYLITENLTSISLIRTLCGAISNVLLNLWLIPGYGITGAAIATLIAQFIANMGYDFIDHRLHDALRVKLLAIVKPWQAFYNIRTQNK